MLISRFLINLRNVDKTVTTVGAGDGPSASKAYTVSAVSTMQFSGDGSRTRAGTDREEDEDEEWDGRGMSGRIIGPMGEDLEDGARWLEEGDEDGEGESTERTYESDVTPTVPSANPSEAEKADIQEVNSPRFLSVKSVD